MKKRKIIFVVAAVLLISLFAFSACDFKVVSKYDDHFEDDVRFTLDFSRLEVMHMDIGEYENVLSMVIDYKNSYFEFKKDGTLHGQIKTNADIISTVVPLLNGIPNLDLSSFDLASGLEQYVEPMFPGFTAHLTRGDLKGALALAKRTLGLNIEGLDYEDEGVKEILSYVGEHMSLPNDIFSKLPEDTQLAITLDTHYVLKKVVGEDGKEYTAIYVGDDVANRNEQTNAFATFTMTDYVEENGEFVYDDDGALVHEDGTPFRQLCLVIEFMAVKAYLVESR